MFTELSNVTYESNVNLCEIFVQGCVLTSVSKRIGRDLLKKHNSFMEKVAVMKN